MYATGGQLLNEHHNHHPNVRGYILRLVKFTYNYIVMCYTANKLHKELNWN